MRLLLLLFLLTHGAAAASVPGCHGDRDRDHRSRENCSGAGLSRIPAGLDRQTQVLLFPFNLFSSLSWTSFQIFPAIYELDLTANQVPEVAPSSAPVLPGLSVLRLGSNRLTFLSDGAFAACPALTELHLENNSLASLTDRAFSGLSRLEILDLTANRISRLPGLMLHPLQAIETLYLEDNKIQVMPDGWFSQKEEVPYLYLSANPWACSCSLGYLRRYLEEYELNVYVRDGPIISSDVDSVVCDSPPQHQGTPVMSLEESDLCSAEEEPGPPGDFYQSVTSLPPAKTTPGVSVQPSTPEPPAALETSSVASAAPPKPTTPDLMTVSPEQASVAHRVVTWSWYQTFTSVLERSYYSWSEIETGSSVVRLFAQTTRPIPAGPSAAPFRTVPPTRTSTTLQAVPAAPFRTVPPTRTSTTLQAVPAAPFRTVPPTRTSTTVPAAETSLVPDQSAGIRRPFKVMSAGGGAVLCVWLFAGCLLLCVASAACVLVTLVRLIFWYKKVYQPLRLTLASRVKGSKGVALLMKRKMEDAAAGDGGVVALYRSLLFVNREGGDIVEDRDRGQIITLKMPGEEPADRGVYRKTMYRLISKEEELEGWRDVLEECRVSAEDGGRKRETKRDEEAPGGVSRKRYSVILREEREAGGGQEELDWVVGGWEVNRGVEEGPRSSWGEWLADYLPSMPWGLTAPSEEEAAAK
ncbi:uncharacterized protein FYW61_019775 [Anableps anableps]